jgi:hypothetical protein
LRDESHGQDAPQALAIYLNDLEQIATLSRELIERSAQLLATLGMNHKIIQPRASKEPSQRLDFQRASTSMRNSRVQQSIPTRFRTFQTCNAAERLLPHPSVAPRVLYSTTSE